MSAPKNPIQRTRALVAMGSLLAALAGASAGVLSTPAAAQSGCGKQACDVQYNTCFNTDIDYNCSGDPCKSSECKVLPEP